MPFAPSTMGCMDYDTNLHAFISDALPEGFKLGLNKSEPVIENVECIDLGGAKKYLLTQTPAEVLWEGESD